MITDLKPYSAMKDSGVEWLGEVPEHWEVRRLKYLLRERDTRSSDGSEQLLRVSQYTGVTERKSVDGTDEPNTRAASLVGYKCVSPNELVVNIMLAWNGSMGVSAFTGIASPAYCVYRFNNCAVPWYFHNLLRSPSYKARIKVVSTGIVESRLRLYTDDLYCLEGLLPPLPEQAAIVRYLDYVDRRVQRFVQAKQKLIGLLEEEKQAVIHRAVTRGLDPDVPLKDTGVEWLGEVPEHWEVRRNGRLFAQRKETGFADLPILEVSLRTGVRVRDFNNSDRKQVMSDRDKYKRAVSGDIAYNMMRMWQGAVGVAPTDGLISPAYVVAKPLPETESRYFIRLFRTAVYMAEIDKYSRGIVKDRNRLYWEDFKRMPSCYPPHHEQVAIADAVDRACNDIDTTIDRARREIELLNEYRTRLIADVVTGKLDVREAAAGLSDVPEPRSNGEVMDDDLMEVPNEVQA